MSRIFCKYKNTQYPVNATICKDGHIAVCMPDGKWDISPEVCQEEDETLQKTPPSGSDELNVSAHLHSSLFPDDIIVDAQKAQKSTGCLSSVTLAQWALESGYGKYQLNANNPFGIKWYQGCKFSYVIRNTREFVGGHWQVIPAKFIAFPSLADAFLMHGEILMDPNGPYKAALQYRSDWRAFITAIAPVYATDPVYAKSMISIVETNSLNSFDLPS